MAPKLIADIFNLEAQYGILQSGPPNITRGSTSETSTGFSECRIHS